MAKALANSGLVRRFLGGFSPGDVMLADALYCNYFLIATLMAAGVDVLFEQNGARITDFRRGQSLGVRDHLVCWRKPAARPEWMTPQQYAGFADEITVREARVDRQGASYLGAVFGPHHYALLPRPEVLPAALLDWPRRLVAG